jgi:MoaA/NifB/PqqE/SkfB family radical SAM enzyme
MRRCNLACTYCNEFDKTSDPVALDEMLRRIDRLAEFGTSVVTISGGEPMMHPEIFEIIARIRHHGMIAGLISNGYYFQPDKIQKLNEAGLDYLQISIDNVNPDDVSNKSLKVLDAKLVNLKEHAKFKVNINSVLGSGVANPGDALTIAERARELGFSSTVGVIHDGDGLLKPLNANEKEIYKKVKALGTRSYARWNWFQDNLAEGKEYEWRCRAGARYLYIDEAGIVSWCSQQRGTPGISIHEYTTADMEREYITEKWCAPSCTIQCVHQVGHLDAWRDKQISLTEYNGRISKKTISKVMSQE